MTHTRCRSATDKLHPHMRYLSCRSSETRPRAGARPTQRTVPPCRSHHHPYVARWPIPGPKSRGLEHPPPRWHTAPTVWHVRHDSEGHSPLCPPTTAPNHGDTCTMHLHVNMCITCQALWVSGDWGGVEQPSKCSSGITAPRRAVSQACFTSQAAHTPLSISWQEQEVQNTPRWQWARGAVQLCQRTSPTT
mgnify:CR=1 FL=1